MNKSSIQSLSQLFFNPSHQYRNGVLLLFFCQQFSGWYMMPFEEATTATAACGMLGNKYRMPSHWCLLTVIRNYGRCKAFGNEILCMSTDCCQAFFFNIIFFLLRKTESAAESRFGQSFKQICQIVLFVSRRVQSLTHRNIIFFFFVF